MKFVARRKLQLVLIDYFLFLLAYVIGMFLRFQTDYTEMMKFFSPVMIYPVIMVITLYATKIYNYIWRFATIVDLLPIIYSGIVGFLVNFIFIEVLRRYITKFFVLPISVAAIASMLGIIFISMSRIYWVKHHQKNNKKIHSENNILIIGAGDAGVQLLNEFDKTPVEGNVVGLLDDDIKKIGRNIRGYKVLDTTSEVMKYVESMDVKEVVIAIPSASSEDMKRILASVDTKKVRLRTLPSLFEILNNKLSLGFLRDVDITDLLGRKEIKADLDKIEKYIKGKKVLITGAGGSIGSEICRQISACNPEILYILGRGENSIFTIKNELQDKFENLKVVDIICDTTDYNRLEKIFNRFEFDLVFHAAAHKHVALMEKNPFEAFKVNTIGTYNVASLAGKHNVERFIFISTDKAINPTSIMGTSKRFGEIAIRSIAKNYKTHFGIVRFGNVFGSRGSVIPIFKEQIAKGGPVKVTHPDMKRFFMTIPEAVALVLQASIFAENGEVFILDMGEQMSIDNLARELIRLSGFVPDQDIKIVYTGPKPGEKLYEELFLKDEKYDKTENDRIFIAKLENHSLNQDEIEKILKNLNQVIIDHDSDKLQLMIREYVPDSTASVKNESAY